jgi:hypothetical protein
MRLSSPPVIFSSRRERERKRKKAAGHFSSPLDRVKRGLPEYTAEELSTRP